ncbi:hypothetical protein J007_01982 [Cryptococcus neoformans]|nr:hypothetical protein J007_01982 [Cryptococcus neoformans var. grubii]OXC62597.1 hypothetical protein C358_02026 [Cryptococcus neoformans var. grubii MW-RSA852]
MGFPFPLREIPRGVSRPLYCSFPASAAYPSQLYYILR